LTSDCFLRILDLGLRLFLSGQAEFGFAKGVGIVILSGLPVAEDTASDS
jgi:hypothetical protein